MVVEIEAVLNDRPLTYVSNDSQDPEPLTPSHLLYTGMSSDDSKSKINLSNLDPMTAAISSNLGSVNSLSGATRAFDIMRDETLSWQIYVTAPQIYVTAPKPFLLASTNT